MDIEGDFIRDGAVCVRGAVTPEHLSLAREAIEANLADLSPLAKRASGADDGAFVEDFCSWTRLPAMERFVLGPGRKAAEVVAELTGATQVRLYHDHVLVKEAGTRQVTEGEQISSLYSATTSAVSSKRILMARSQEMIRIGK